MVEKEISDWYKTIRAKRRNYETSGFKDPKTQAKIKAIKAKKANKNQPKKTFGDVLSELQ